MQRDIERVLIGRDAIASRLDELAASIVEDMDDERRRADGGAFEVTLVPILVGSVIFLADLIRRLPLRMQIHVMSMSSYPGRTVTSRGAQVQSALTSLPDDLAGRHVLLIDDILDSGGTLRLATRLIGERKPVSVRSCVLLRKRRPEAMAQPVDYVAFEVPDEFVVGYGLDYDGYYRNLPDIVTLRPEVVSS